MKIAIMGTGKMGGWLAKTLAAEHEVAAYDIDSARVAQLGVRALSRPEDMRSFAPQLLINAVSLQNTVEAFRNMVPNLPSGCILSDVASVKGDLPKYYEGCGFRFASVHPMFGPTLANMSNLIGENAVIIKESDREASSFFRGFFSSLGLKLHEYSFSEHDRMMGYSLTTPFVSSLVFASCVDNATVPGTTFAKHMAIARGLLAEDDRLLCEILFNPYSLPQLGNITSKLEHLKHIIKGRDTEEATEFLSKLRKNVR